MIDFLNKYVDKPISGFIKKNPELSIGLGALGLGASGYMLYRQKKAGERVKKVWEAYKKKYKDANKANIEKIRRASKLKLKADYVKPEDMEKIIGTKDNAFFVSKELANSFEGAPGFKTDKKTDPKFGHVYYTDSTKSLPVIAHEYGHGESAHKGQAPTIWGNLGRALLALGAGTGTYYGLTALGAKAPSAIIGGALASAAGNYLINSYVIDEEERASANARRYLKALKHSKKRFAADEEMLDSALDTYKEHQRGELTKGLLSPLVSLGVTGGALALLDKYGHPGGGQLWTELGFDA